MSGYSSDGVLSISSTSDSISTKNRDQSPLSCNDKEKGRTEQEKKPWYAKYQVEESESDKDTLRGTTSACCIVLADTICRCWFQI